MRRPMLLLTIGIAIFDVNTRLTRLETDAPRNAAICTGVGRRIAKLMLHFQANLAVLAKNEIGKNGIITRRMCNLLRLGLLRL